MSIDSRCREQCKVADQMFLAFQYTRPGSSEQIKALETLTFLIGMWADFFLHSEAKRMDSAIDLMKSLSDS